MSVDVYKRQADGWDIDSKLGQAMDALQLPDSDMPVNVLSGGERRRVALCKLLLEAPDLLLLDEPTNHLDAESILWLEHFLHNYQGAVLAVTHDRYFLDNVAEWICCLLYTSRPCNNPMKEHIMSFLTSMFKTEKPVIGMLHLRPLPGDPLYYPGGSVSQVVEAAKRDLEALQQGGVDGILITNELSMPYEQHVSPSTLASMGYVIGALSHDLSTPWGAEAIYDGDATIELCAAVDAQFTRCNFCGAWAGDLGLINRDFAHTMRRKAALRLDDLKLFHFITSEGEVYLNDRTTADIADSLLFNCLPDAMVIGGSAAGRGASGELADEVRERVGEVPVVCGTGCRENTVADVFAHYDGAFVGTCLKRDGKLDAPVDVERVVRFMAAARTARGE